MMHSQVCCPARSSPLSAAAAVDNPDMAGISQRRVTMRNDFKVWRCLPAHVWLHCVSGSVSGPLCLFAVCDLTLV